MKTTTITLLTLFLSSSLFAQNNDSFDANAGYYADAFDVEWTMPKGMTDMNTRESMTVRQGYRLVHTNSPVLRSEDGECVLMYGSEPLFISDEMAKFNEESKNLARKVHGAQDPDAIDPAGNNDNVHRLLMSSELGVIYGYRDEMARKKRPANGSMPTRYSSTTCLWTIPIKAYTPTARASSSRKREGPDSCSNFTSPTKGKRTRNDTCRPSEKRYGIAIPNGSTTGKTTNRLFGNTPNNKS